MFTPKLLALSVALVLSPVSPAQSSVLLVDPAQGEFETIQAAIDAAQPGDVVEIAPGIYDEELFITDGDLTLRAAGDLGSVILDGNEDHRILLVRDSALRIEKLVFRDALSDYGAGIYALSGFLGVSQCQFLRNRALYDDGESLSGGAVFSTGEGAICTLTECLFVENETSNGHGSGYGGAVAFTVRPGLGAPFADEQGEYRSSFILDPAASWSEVPIGTAAVRSCTFIGNRGDSGSAVYASENRILAVQSSLFLDQYDPGTVIQQRFERGLDLTTCSIFWQHGVPLEEPGLSRAASYGEPLGTDLSRIVDPRICWPQTSGVPLLHRSSPALDPEGCGPIGNLEEGCSEAAVLSVSPNLLDAETNVRLAVYGYGIDDVNHVELVGPNGEVVGAHALSVESTWLTVRFNLWTQPAGLWTLVLRSNGEDVVRVPDAVEVLSAKVYALLDGWIEEGGFHARMLVGRALHPGLELTLVHSETDTRVDVTLEPRQSTDTLRVEFDLSGADEGLYDLEVTDSNGQAQTLPSALYFGEPPVILVPSEVPTVSGAVEAARPGTRILLEGGVYAETIVIDRAISLEASTDARPTIEPAEGEGRAIEILHQAGSLVRIVGLTVSRSTAQSGDGGGLLSEGCVEIVESRFDHCRTGPFGNGGAVRVGPGSRIRDCEFVANQALGELTERDAWPIWQGQNTGLGGGLYGMRVLVERCRFVANSALNGGALVLSGSLLQSTLENNRIGFEVGSCASASEFILSGTMIGNQVLRDSDYSSLLYGIVEGPSRVAFNTFYGLDGYYSESRASVLLRGAIDFYNNSAANVGLFVCPFHREGADPGGRLSIRNNLIRPPAFWSPWELEPCCTFSPGQEPAYELGPENIEMSCNIAGLILDTTEDIFSECDSCVIAADPEFCDAETGTGDREFDLRIRLTSPALPANNPFACADTLGALSVGCGIIPVLLEMAELRWLPEGAVELNWRVSSELNVIAFEIERHSRVGTTLLTDSPLPRCDDCRFLDVAPPVGGGLSYTLVLLFPNQGPIRIPLGEIEPGANASTRFDLVSLSPNPARGETLIRYNLPQRGQIRADLVDIRGRSLFVFFDETVGPGTQQRRLEIPGRVGAGVYWVRLQSAQGSDSEPLVLLH